MARMINFAARWLGRSLGALLLAWTIVAGAAPATTEPGPALFSAWTTPVAGVVPLPEPPQPLRETIDLIRALQPAAPDFRQAMSADPDTAHPTELRLAWDSRRLYLLFTCRGGTPAGAVGTGRESIGPLPDDPDLGRQECLEIFLEPAPGEPYFHLMLSRTGARLDERGRLPGAWNGTWIAQIAEEPDGWIALIQIPFAELGVPPPRPGTVWRGNAGRCFPHPTLDISSWAPVPDLSFHRTECFGSLLFGGPGAPVATLSPLAIDRPGEHRATVHLRNPGAAPVWLRAELRADGESAARYHRELAPGESDWLLTMPFWEPGRHRLELAISTTDGRVLCRPPPLTVEIPPYLARLAEYSRLLEPLTTANRPPAGITLESVRRAPPATPESLAALSRRLDALSGPAEQARHRTDDAAGTGYVLRPESALRKILRRNPATAPDPDAAGVRISLCRNEYESAQVLIHPYRTALTAVAVTCRMSPPEEKKTPPVLIPFTQTRMPMPSDLPNPFADVELPFTLPPLPSLPTLPTLPFLPPAPVRPQVTLNLVELVKTRPPPYPAPPPDWVPDPLVEIRPFDAAMEETRAVWVTAYAPPGCPAGRYRGEIRVHPANAPAQVIPLEIEVWDFELPRELHLKTAFALDEEELAAWYGEVTPELRRTWYEAMLRFRLNPGSIYAHVLSPPRADLDWSLDRGLNAIHAGYLGPMPPERMLEFLRRLEKTRDLLRSRNAWDKAYIFGFDEASPAEYPRLRETFSQIKTAFPDIPIMCTVAPNDELRGYVDIWVPLTAFYNPDTAARATAAGNQVWWYVCCYPWAPYANWFIDYPILPARLLFWMNWKYRVPGVLYYSVNMWRSNREVETLPGWLHPSDDAADRDALRAGKRWPEVPWNSWSCLTFNGDGQLFYPGPGGAPVPSIRLAAIRDGIEDYEYFWQLRQRLTDARNRHLVIPAGLEQTAEELLAVPRTIVASLTEYTDDPDAVLATRRQTAETILALDRLLLPAKP